LHHTGEEIFYNPKPNVRHQVGLYTRIPVNRQLFHSTGHWFIKQWAYETLKADGNKDWWYVWNREQEILEITSGKEPISELLNIKPIITAIPKHLKSELIKSKNLAL